MVSVKQSAKGNDNVQIIGSNNVVAGSVLVMSEIQPLTHSLVHELLDVVYSQPSPKSSDYSLRNPAQIHEKLRFNNATKYISIIDNHSDDYVRVGDVMKDYPNSEDIVKRLRDMFLDVVDNFDDNGNPCVGDGNAQLDSIKEKLVRMIIADANFNADNHVSEQIDQFCIALIAYGISKCKILETPV